MFRLVTCGITIIGLAGPVAAQGIDGAAERLAAELTRAPDRVMDRVVEIIHGYGDGARMTEADVVRMVGVERAAARGRAMGQLLAADLDADGRVAHDEAVAAGAVLSARARSRLMRAVADSDTDQDGSLDPTEIAAAGRGAALRAVSESAASRDLALLMLDRDGDGAVTLAEARDAVDAATAMPASAKAGDGGSSGRGG